MFKKASDFSSKYSSMFFCISLLIILIFLIYFSIINRDKKINCVIPNQIVNNSNNYSYEVTYMSSFETIKLNINRYNQKYLIELEQEGLKKTYYVNHMNIYEKASNGEFIKYRSDFIINNVDNNLLLLDYINDLSLESNLTINDGLTCYVNRRKETTICVNLDDSITLKGNDYSINYSIKEVAKIKDFNVIISGDNN